MSTLLLVYHQSKVLTGIHPGLPLLHHRQDEECVAQPEKEDDDSLHHPDLLVHELDPPPEAEYSQPLPCYAREAEFCEVFGVKEEDDDDELEILVDQQ